MWENRHAKRVRADTLWPNDSTSRNPWMDMLIQTSREVHTRILTAALFVVAKVVNKGPSMGELSNQ